MPTSPVQISDDAVFDGADLTDADLSGDASMAGTSFNGAILNGANFTGAVAYIQLNQAQLEHANFTDAVIQFGLTASEYADFSSANFIGAQIFSGGPGGQMVFTSANLTGAYLAGSFSGSDFTSADLQDATLTYADFSNTDFNAASLAGVTFEVPVNFSEATFYGASFLGDTLTGVNFNGATWYSTTCPDGTSSNAYGACPGAKFHRYLERHDGGEHGCWFGRRVGHRRRRQQWRYGQRKPVRGEPPGNLLGGTGYFDVAVSAGGNFNSVIIQDCNNIEPTSTMSWNDAGTWEAVSLKAVYEDATATSSACLSFTVLPSGTSPDLAQLTGTIFASVQAPSIACSKLSGVTGGRHGNSGEMCAPLESQHIGKCDDDGSTGRDRNDRLEDIRADDTLQRHLCIGGSRAMQEGLGRA